MTAADEKPLVAEGYALLDQGRWYACLRYLRDGKPVGEDLIFKNAPRLNQHEATVLAHLQAQRANRGQPLELGATEPALRERGAPDHDSRF